MGRRECREASERGGPTCTARDDRQRAQSQRIVADGIGGTYAHPHRPVSRAHLAGFRPQQSGAHNASHIVGGHRNPVRLRLVDAHHQLGGRFHHAVKQVREALDPFEIGGEALGVHFERIQLLPEQLDLDWLRRACEIVDHVR